MPSLQRDDPSKKKKKNFFFAMRLCEKQVVECVKVIFCVLPSVVPVETASSGHFVIFGLFLYNPEILDPKYSRRGEMPVQFGP